MKKSIFTISILALSMFTTLPVVAEEPEKCSFEITGGADIVSTYIFRGINSAGASIQPTLNASYAGLKLGFWGSSDFNNDIQEFDLGLSYSIAGLTVSATDIYGPYSTAQNLSYSKFDNHFIEGAAIYDFSEKCGFGLVLAWRTNFCETGDFEDDYSTYISASYNFDVKDVSCTAHIGVTPWKGFYDDKFNVSDVWFKAEKDIKITNDFSLPLFVQAIVAPACEKSYLVAGISFKL